MRRRVLSSTSALVLLGLVLVTCDRADSPTKPPVPVASVVVAPARDTLAVGGTVQLTATPQDQGGNPLNGRAITWRSTNPAVASVTGAGLVTALAPGSTTIQAESEGRTGESIIAVLGDPDPRAEQGEWSDPFDWPIVAVHLHLLPNGKVLSWGKRGGANGAPFIWDPATEDFSGPIATSTHLFCAGHSFMADGRMFVTGGHIADDRGLPDANIFDAATQTFTRVPNMARGRWYPTNTTMPNGEVVVIAGRDENGDTVEVAEVWQTNGQWRALTTAAKDLPYYPRMFVAPNGLLFHAGESQQTHYLDPSGTGTWTFVANRQFAPLREYGSAVMYEPGKILYAGGGRTPPTNTAEVIDLNQPSPAWRYTNPMAYARRQMNATLLPDGTVLVTGGTSSPGFNNPAGAIRAAELWDPSTEEWRTLASNQIVRVYHSTTLLLPDARVLHTGSGDSDAYGGDGRAPDELNAEIFTPPYLFNFDGSLAARPVITSAPTTVGYGQAFSVGTPDAASITKVSWIRLGSVTHAFDMNQRYNSLSFERTADGLTVTAPANANLAPPGHYMMFIVNGSGVPSVASIIQVQ